MGAPERAGWVVPLHAAGVDNAAIVGTKAATLGRLVRGGIAVPEALVLTTDAAAALLGYAGLGPDATAGQVLAAPVPAQVESALVGIGNHFGDAALAVRSSADEDPVVASFAGTYDSVLHVRGLDELRAAARRCWASAYGERARSHRQAQRNVVPSPIAVLVQRQVDADVVGMASTVNPASGADEALVSAVPGPGDYVVSGAELPDEWVVTGSAATALRVNHQALAEQQARNVAALALRVQHVLGGRPQKVQWAMAGGRLLVLQARPITTPPRPLST